MKSAKALVAMGVTFIVAVVGYAFPELPKELVVSGGTFLTGLGVYFVPNKM